jgi:hypothetical protein
MSEGPGVHGVHGNPDHGGHTPTHRVEPGAVPSRPELHLGSGDSSRPSSWAHGKEEKLGSVQIEDGSPTQYHRDWFYEVTDGYCVPSSVSQIISAQSGITLHSTQLVEEKAAELGIPAANMNLQQAQELLHAFNVPSHLEPGNVQQLAQFLQEGRNIVLSVNASPIWYGTETSPDNTDGRADHALVVSAINPITGQVTLSDPGTQGGNEEVVSMQTFQEAWAASDDTMLVTDDPAGGADHAAVAATVQQMDSSPTSPGIQHDLSRLSVLLPIALGVVAGLGADKSGRVRRAASGGSGSPAPAPA